jgi:hypothetical protein
VAAFIGYPAGRVLAVLDGDAQADRAMVAVRRLGLAEGKVERLHGVEDADRFAATGERHGPVARVLRTVQFGLMDQLPALAWYEAALREGRTVLSAKTRKRATTLQVVEAIRAAGGHFINHFGRAATEEFARWQGPEPNVPSLMKH